jgi:hypothetical protein
MSRKIAVTVSLLLLLTFMTVPALGGVFPQTPSPIPSVQAAVRDRIMREVENVDVTFPDWLPVRTYYVSNSRTGVTGEGMYASRNDYRNAMRFTYDAVVNRNGRVEQVTYRIIGANDQSPTTGTITGRSRPYDVPSWLVGTYTGRSPTNRRTSTLNINYGAISVVDDRGNSDYGNYSAGQINFGNNYSWTIEQNGQNLRVRDAQTGRTAQFRRTSTRVGDDVNLPQSIAGIFRNDQSELIISPDGTAAMCSLVDYELVIGRYSNGVLSFNAGSYDVTQRGNEIRITERGNRRNQITYRRVN